MPALLCPELKGMSNSNYASVISHLIERQYKMPVQLSFSSHLVLDPYRYRGAWFYKEFLLDLAFI